MRSIWEESCEEFQLLPWYPEVTHATIWDRGNIVVSEVKQEDEGSLDCPVFRSRLVFEPAFQSAAALSLCPCK